MSSFISQNKIVKRLKKIFRKKDLVIFIIFTVMSFFFMALWYRPGFMYNLCTVLFVIGLLHTLTGFCVYIKNVGLFKLFTYTLYKKNFKLHADKADPMVRPLTLAEYTLEKMKNQSSMQEYFIIGVPFLIVSYVIAFTIN